LDLSKFGARELEMTEELLRAFREQGLPDDFEDEGLSIMLNTHSGYVFFTNSEYQVAMMNGDKLESFYSCPYCGHEGFRDDMAHEPKDDECTEYFKSIGMV